jgi:ferredoxin
MLTVNPNYCIGCQNCKVIFPEFFDIGDDGRSYIKKDPSKIKTNDEVDEILTKVGCPAHAIEKI